MPCKQATIPGPEPAQADRPQVQNLSAQISVNEATLAYTINNPNDFETEVSIKESITNKDSGQELDSNTITRTLSPNGSTDETVTFTTNLGTNESMPVALCADIQNFSNANA